MTATKLRPATVAITDDMHAHGYVKHEADDGGQFHLDDLVTNNISHRDMTGEKPDYGPYPMSHVAKAQGIVYHDEDDEDGEGVDYGQLRPGYYRWYGLVARVRPGQKPEYWDGSDWKPVQDSHPFDKTAESITAREAEEIARKHGVMGAF